MTSFRSFPELSEIASPAPGAHQRAQKPSLKEAALTAADVRALLDYDPKTGLLTWKRALSRRMPVGSVAGTKNPEGYWRIGIARKVYVLPRVIWLHVYGVWPDGEVDHRDLDPSNNRIDNLRVATRRLNEVNKPCRSKCGFKGVSFEPRTGRWKAAIRVAGRSTHLGFYPTAALAGDAYARAAVEQYGEFARV